MQNQISSVYCWIHFSSARWSSFKPGGAELLQPPRSEESLCHVSAQRCPSSTGIGVRVSLQTCCRHRGTTSVRTCTNALTDLRTSGSTPTGLGGGALPCLRPTTPELPRCGAFKAGGPHMRCPLLAEVECYAPKKRFFFFKLSTVPQYSGLQSRFTLFAVFGIVNTVHSLSEPTKQRILRTRCLAEHKSSGRVSHTLGSGHRKVPALKP